jgi:hypothetical protein
MHSIDSEILKRYIEPHFHRGLTQKSYSVEEVESNTLLIYKRLDLAFKLFYLSLLEKNISFAKKMYAEHIRAFSLGEFTEPGNSDKNSIEKYIESFNATFLRIKEYGFDSKQTLIPITIDKTIVNGAHRVASAIYLHKKVSYVTLACDSPCYDYKFFYQRNVPTGMLDQAVTTFVEYSDNVHIAFIWPIAKSTNEQIEAMIPNIVYQKEIILTPNGAHNLISQIYYGESWLGNVENDFSGAKGKLVECFKSFDPVKVVVFQAENLDKVLQIKEKIRKTFNVGKHSVHITDTKEETLRTVQLVLNKNSIHFLNYAKPNRFRSTHNKINIFKYFLEKNKISTTDIAIDSSMVLSVYGLREAKDIDYLCAEDIEVFSSTEGIHAHDEVLTYYRESKHELIYNPQNYFYFNDIKFIAFNTVYDMKQSRAEAKDINDYKMMEALIENNQIKVWVSSYKQKLFYLRVLVRQKIIGILQNIGLFDVVYDIYKKLKRSHG